MNEPTVSNRAGAASGPAPTNNILDGYHPVPGSFDEARSDAALRPHWRRFVRQMQRLGLPELARRWQHAQRLVHENGIAYSAFGDPTDKTRPWELDPIPMLLPSAEWVHLEKGLAQRARLLNQLLADLYGPQESLKRNILPPEVLFRHSGYLRAFWGQNRRSTSEADAGTRKEFNEYLHFYAADLGRSPDGKWWILGDRTEAPSGIGFALENRIVTSRVLPDAIRQCQVARLASFFSTVRDTLRRSAQTHRENPRVVLLSQGTGSPNYFEDAYLARYLGYILAQGDDLAVRNNRVSLKTLGGLVPIDVLLRRPNSRECDPLELDPTAHMGTAGLMQVARSNHVAVVNAFGSGLVESPVFMAFLPELCQLLLGESLILPSVATWWCGTPTALAYVLENVDRLLIRPAYRQRGHERGICQELSSLTRVDLIARLKANPAMYVAQEQVARSMTPVMRAGQGSGDDGELPVTIEPSRFALRAFAVASDDSYTVMPGGLGRTSSTNEPLVTSLATGEGSKDVWVLTDRPVQHISLLTSSSGSMGLRRSGAELPSRVADHTYWLGRNLERADCMARLLRTVLLRMTSESALDTMDELPTLLRTLAETGQIEPGYVVDEIRLSLPVLEQHLPRFVLDDTHADSLRTTIGQLYRTAAIVRDRISVDAWRIIHRLEKDFRPTGNALELADLLSMVEDVIIDLSAVSGLVMESMTRTHMWRFLDLGRRVERVVQTVSLVDTAFGDAKPVPGALLEAVLETADSIMTYRARYLASLELPAVLDLLLVDESNPRSVAYQLVAIAEHVDLLPRETMPTQYSKEQRLAMEALHIVRMLDILSVADAHGLGDASPLTSVLERVGKLLPDLSDAINHRYLVHAGPTHQLMNVSQERSS